MNITKAGVQTSPQRRDWTLLYVLDGDNDLREAATRDLVELDQTGTPDSVHVAAQLYRGELKWNFRNLPKKLAQLAGPKIPPAVQTDWRGMRVYEVRQEGGSVPTHHLEEKASAQASPSDPEALEDFIAWGMKTYPAENYAVILTGHGSQRGVLSDSEGARMSMQDASAALQRASEKTGEKVNLLVLDSCSTASKETAAAFQGAADYLVASPEKVKGQGWSEAFTLGYLEENQKAAPVELGESFLSPAHTSVRSAVLYQLSDGSTVAQRDGV